MPLASDVSLDRSGEGGADKSMNARTGGKEGGLMQLREMDDGVRYQQQLREDGGPVVLINVFNVAPEDAERLLEVWADDAAFMKQQPGFVSTQLHRGTAGSSTFVNVAEWDSARALGAAFGSPEFQQRLAQYPESAVASPHVFEKVEVPGI
jgi:heme-degrading monooxygenase HmoA